MHMLHLITVFPARGGSYAVPFPQLPGALLWHIAVNTGDADHVFFGEPLPALQGQTLLIGGRSGG